MNPAQKQFSLNRAASRKQIPISISFVIIAMLIGGCQTPTAEKSFDLLVNIPVPLPTDTVLLMLSPASRIGVDSPNFVASESKKLEESVMLEIHSVLEDHKVQVVTNESAAFDVKIILSAQLEQTDQLYESDLYYYDPKSKFGRSKRTGRGARCEGFLKIQFKNSDTVYVERFSALSSKRVSVASDSNATVATLEDVSDYLRRQIRGGRAAKIIYGMKPQSLIDEESRLEEAHIEANKDIIKRLQERRKQEENQ